MNRLVISDFICRLVRTSFIDSNKATQKRTEAIQANSPRRISTCCIASVAWERAKGSHQGTWQWMMLLLVLPTSRLIRVPPWRWAVSSRDYVPFARIFATSSPAVHWVLHSPTLISEDLRWVLQWIGNYQQPVLHAGEELDANCYFHSSSTVFRQWRNRAIHIHWSDGHGNSDEGYVHHLFHTFAIRSPSINTILATPVLIRIRCCALKRLELAKKTIVLHKERVNIERRASYTI